MSELLLPGVIRTLVPAIVGAVAAMFASRFGIVLTDQASVDLTAAFTSIVTVLYYVGIRIVAQRFNVPGLEKFLGTNNPPLYLKAKK